MSGTPKVPSKGVSKVPGKTGGSPAVRGKGSTPELTRRTPDGSTAPRPARTAPNVQRTPSEVPARQQGAARQGAAGRAPDGRRADGSPEEAQSSPQAASEPSASAARWCFEQTAGAKSRAAEAGHHEPVDEHQNGATNAAGAALEASGLSGTARGVTGRMSDGSKMDAAQRGISIASDYVPILRDVAKLPQFEKVIGTMNNRRYLVAVGLSVLGPFLPAVVIFMIVAAIGMSGVSTQTNALTQAASKVQEEAAPKDKQVQAQECVTGTNASKTDDSANGCDQVTVTSANGGSSSNELGTASADRQAVVDYARQFLGVPYTWGGNNPDEGMDCSGYMVWIFKHFNISLPRTAEAMRDSGKSVSRDQLKPGDLIVWTDHGHVAMYVGDDRMVEEPKPGLSAREVPLRDLDRVIFRSIIND